MNNNLEKRVLDLCKPELRSGADGKPKITGYGAVFDSLSQNLGGFREKIRKGAFARTLKEGGEVRALFNHDPNCVLGRQSAGTLSLREDDTGLLYEIDPPDTTYARDLVECLKRGDISGSSFSFRCKTDSWRDMEDGLQVRELIDVDLFDVGPVTEPAYTDTTAAVRAFQAHRQAADTAALEERERAARLRLAESE